MTAPASARGLFADRFELLGELGSGGQATVYEARDRIKNSLVALKVFSGIASPTRSQDLTTLSHRLKDLNDDRLCPILETGTFEGEQFLTMPILRGQSLAQEIASRKSESQNQSSLASNLRSRIRFIEEVALAIHKIHENGLIHRDLKPANVMISSTGQPVILDFGLTRSDESSSGATTALRSTAGTPAYMAPECITGTSPSDRRGDVFALGTILFETLVGTKMFAAATPAKTFNMIAEERFPRLRDFVPEASESLEALINRSVSKDPDKRPPSALAFAEDLAAIREGKTVRPQAARLPAAIHRWLRRNPRFGLVIAATAFAALIACGVIGFALARRPLIADGQRIIAEREREHALTATLLNLSEGIPSRSADRIDELLGDGRTPDAELLTIQVFFELVAAKPEAARDLLDRHPDLVRQQPELRILRANSLRLDGRYAEAKKIDAALKEPVNAAGHFICGVHATFKSHGGDINAARTAVRHFKEALAMTSPARMIYLAELAHAATHAEDWASADQATHALVTRWPSDFAPWFWKGFSLVDRDSQAALAAFNEALERDPGAEFCRLAIARCHNNLGDQDAAFRIVKDVADREPKIALAHLELARLYVDKGQFAEAHRRLLMTLHLEPRSLSSMQLLIYILEQTDRKDEAGDLARRFLEFGGRGSATFRHLGRIAFIDGFYFESQAAYGRAMRSRDRYPADALARARSLTKAGQFGLAERIIASIPSAPPLRRHLIEERNQVREEIDRQTQAMDDAIKNDQRILNDEAFLCLCGYLQENKKTQKLRGRLEERLPVLRVENVSDQHRMRYANFLASASISSSDALATASIGEALEVLGSLETKADAMNSRQAGAWLFILRRLPRHPAWKTLRDRLQDDESHPSLRSKLHQLDVHVEGIVERFIETMLTAPFPQPKSSR